MTAYSPSKGSATFSATTSPPSCASLTPLPTLPGASLRSAETLEHRRAHVDLPEGQGGTALESQSLPVEGGTDIPFVRAKILVSDNPLSSSKVGCITLLPAGSCRKGLWDAEPFA